MNTRTKLHRFAVTVTLEFDAADESDAWELFSDTTGWAESMQSGYRGYRDQSLVQLPDDEDDD